MITATVPVMAAVFAVSTISTPRPLAIVTGPAVDVTRAAAVAGASGWLSPAAQASVGLGLPSHRPAAQQGFLGRRGGWEEGEREEEEEEE
jgi:hypothetical protein